MISLTKAISKIISIPAASLWINDRGVLKSGYRADICVFDPASIASHCDVRYPRRYATGIAQVLANGSLSMRDGMRTSINAGDVLRGTRAV